MGGGGFFKFSESASFLRCDICGEHQRPFVRPWGEIVRSCTSLHPSHEPPNASRTSSSTPEGRSNADGLAMGCIKNFLSGLEGCRQAPQCFMHAWHSPALCSWKDVWLSRVQLRCGPLLRSEVPGSWGWLDVGRSVSTCSSMFGIRVVSMARSHL